MAIDPNNRLRSWLRKTPQPAKVMLDGSPKRVIDVPHGRDKWRMLLATLRVENPETLTLMDEDGRTLRAREYADAPEDEEPEEILTEQREKDFPIAALAEQFRLFLEHTIEPCMRAMVESMKASDARAQIYAEAQADAIRAQGVADANAIRAQAQAEAQQGSDGGELAAIAKKFMEGAKSGGANGAG